MSLKRSSGASSFIFISSMITRCSFSRSAPSKREFASMSANRSNAASTRSSITFRTKPVSSCVVKASRFPPSRSCSIAMSNAERLSVPLKTQCSIKCEMPFSSFGSFREPMRKKNPSVADRTSGIRSVRTTMPLSRRVCFMSSFMAKG